VCAALLVAWASVMVTDPAAAQPQGSRSAAIFPLKVAWHADLQADPVAALTMDDERIYAVLGAGLVSARSRADGRELWTAALETREPALSDGARVYVSSGDRLHALRVRDGSTAWIAPLGSTAGPFVSVGGWIVVGTERELVALRATDGSEVWRRSLDTAVTGPPEIEGTQVYAGLADGRVMSLRIETGEPLWSRTLPGTPGAILALPDRIYVGASDNFLYALAPRDGTVLWRWRTAADVAWRPAADARHVYFLSFDNVLRALDRRTGSQSWRLPMSVRAIGGPQSAAGLITVPARLGNMYFYVADTGRLAADLQLQAPLIVPPIGLGPVGGPQGLYIATMDSSGAAQIFAYGPGDDAPLAPLAAVPGQPLWPEVPLASRPLPVPWLILPAPPPQGA
jgi:outer membrane protein assembly factor BamB